MKTLMLMLAAAVFTAGNSNAQPGKKPAKQAKPAATPGKIELKTLRDSASYALGYNVGQNLAQRYSDMDLDMMIRALKEAYQGQPCMTDVNTGPMIVNNYTMEAARQKAGVNKEKGRRFLDANKAKPGVKSTESGLQYEVLEQGKGEKPGLNDVVKVHYVGTLINGKEFDNSQKRGAPAEFGVGGVIPGWTEALQLMPVGSKYKLYIPSNLAYGDSQMGNEIPPGSTLIFEVELLEIKKNDPPKTAEPKKEDGQ